MGGEGEEPRVIQHPVGVVPHDHGLEVVVQANTGRPAEMVEGAHVLAQGRRQVHRLDKAQVLPARIAQHVAEQVNPTPAFTQEVQVVDAKIHLRLLARPRLETRHRRLGGTRPQMPDAFAHDGVVARKAARL